MIELFIVSIYLLIGACWVNVADEFIFAKMTRTHKFIGFMFWPLHILIGGITR